MTSWQIVASAYSSIKFNNSVQGGHLFLAPHVVLSEAMAHFTGWVRQSRHCRATTIPFARRRRWEADFACERGRSPTSDRRKEAPAERNNDPGDPATVDFGGSDLKVTLCSVDEILQYNNNIIINYDV